MARLPEREYMAVPPPASSVFLSIVLPTTLELPALWFRSDSATKTVRTFVLRSTKQFVGVYRVAGQSTGCLVDVALWRYKGVCLYDARNNRFWKHGVSPSSPLPVSTPRATSVFNNPHQVLPRIRGRWVGIGDCTRPHRPAHLTQS